MFDELPTLQKLIRLLQHVPYLASKDIYRVADYFLRLDKKEIEQFCLIIQQATENINPCTICFGWQESGRLCQFCSSQSRKSTVVCVVETWQDLMAIEKTQGYQGNYHVLGGAICPLEGINADDLTINALIERVQSDIEEVILATNQTPEGEATAAFIAHKLKQSPVRVSCLARGLPVGSSIKAMDRVTIYKALSERRPF